MRINRKRVVLGVCFGWLLMLIGLISMEGRLPQYLVYNSTASVPVGWYLLITPNDISKGDMVVFTLPEKMQVLAEERGWLPRNTKLLKRVGAIAGEIYGVNQSQQFYVGGVYCGQARSVDGKGRKMPSLSHGGHIVEKDSFLPVGDNPKSFDGRYYGTVPLSCVEYKAVMVLPTGWMIRLWK